VVRSFAACLRLALTAPPALTRFHAFVSGSNPCQVGKASNRQQVASCVQCEIGKFANTSGLAHCYA
jgi:hypothetical protein